MGQSERETSPIPILFGSEEWQEEVERYDRSATPRAAALSARKAVEDGGSKLSWKRCRSDEAPDGTSLPRCLKLYVPLDKEGASAAPYGFVFQLHQNLDNSLILNFLAFGERHPTNERTRTVYERAHKRLHGHYP